MSATLLLREVRLVPLAAQDVAPGHPIDVLVRDGRVSDVAPSGSGLDADASDAETEIVEAEGRWLIPGLWDQHVHLGQWAAARQRVDVAAVDSPEQLLALVARQVGAQPGRPFVTWGHRAGAWRALTVAELDAVSGSTPVGLIAGDGHQAWLNSSALAAVGLAARDDVVREAEWFDSFERFQQAMRASATPADLTAAQREAAARGVVGVVDFEFAGGPLSWPAWHESGATLLRVRASTYADGLDAVIAAGLGTGDPIAGTGGLVSMGPLKVIGDGSLNTRTAWCHHSYAGQPHLGGATHGAPNLSADDLQSLLGRAHAHRLHAAVHAIGDQALSATLDAFAVTGCQGSIEHVQLARAADLARMAALGIAASVQPAHLLDDRDLTESLWPERGADCFAFASMDRLGLELRFGSDAPVAPLDPWLAIAAAVHRSADAREPWHGEQALTVRRSLAASTNGWGMVAPGHPGDLTLLDADPLAVEATAAAGGTREAARTLRNTVVAGTWVAGRACHHDNGLVVC
ncbi:amidohydrolase family protein [Nocardioides dubius]|uniref:Amidohydrolase family protein n=1 Tax=Nocardioides dubius TaxID=317019 RepID=A0ABN1U3C6_9ACTN